MNENQTTLITEAVEYLLNEFPHHIHEFRNEDGGTEFVAVLNSITVQGFTEFNKAFPTGALVRFYKGERVSLHIVVIDGERHQF